MTGKLVDRRRLRTALFQFREISKVCEIVLPPEPEQTYDGQVGDLVSGLLLKVKRGGALNR